MRQTHHIHITPTSVCLNGCPVSTQQSGMAMLNALYRTHIGNYPKYFKMDPLCRLGLVATELLLNSETPRLYASESRAIIFFNSAGSLSCDRHYQQTIQHSDNYYPSPAVFVYTLPNIVTGEIAIRNRYRGETNCYILPHYDEHIIQSTLQATFLDPHTESLIGGWLDLTDENHFEARLAIYIR